MQLSSLVTVIGSWIINFATDVGHIFILLKDTLSRLHKASIKDTIKQMAKLGVDSLPIVIVTTTAAGMVFAVQTSKEFAKLGAGDVVGGIITIAMGRELVPILVGVVVAGRIGAAITAEIGTMKVTEQIEALRVMAVNPISYLVVPRFWACVIMLPILAVFANIVGSWGGFFVSNIYANITEYSYLESIRNICVPFDIIGGLIKCMFFGAIIAIVGCYQGLNTVSGAEGVGLSTTSSVVLSIICIFISNYFLSVLLYV